MRHFLDESGDLPDLPNQASSLVSQLGAIVAWMTSRFPDGEQRTNVTCRRAQARRRCVGEIRAAFQADPLGITWFCPHCEDNGLICGWEDTIWDRGVWRHEPEPFGRERD